VSTQGFNQLTFLSISPALPRVGGKKLGEAEHPRPLGPLWLALGKLIAIAEKKTGIPKKN